MPNPFKSDNRLRRHRFFIIKKLLCFIIVNKKLQTALLVFGFICVTSLLALRGGVGGQRQHYILNKNTLQLEKENAAALELNLDLNLDLDLDLNLEKKLSWCDRVKQERSKLNPDLHITYPCNSSQNNHEYTSAIVTFLTAGVEEGKGSRTVFTGKDYINGALALAASLNQQQLMQEEEHKIMRLLLVRDGFRLPNEEQEKLENVGWIIGKAPKVEIEDKFVPSFGRYKTTYTKIAAIGLSEFKCVLLLDADTLVVGNIDDLLSCNVFYNDHETDHETDHEKDHEKDHPKYQVAGTLDYYHKKWFHFNTGSILWKTDAQEMNRVYALTKDESFMKRFESDQIFLNHVYPDRIDQKKNELLLSEGPYDAKHRDHWGSVVNLGWAYNVQTHVEVQNREFWDAYPLKDLKIIHYTEKKGWQCPELHDGPPDGQVMASLTNCESKKRDPLCFCSLGYLWWDALRMAESIGTK